MLAWVVAEQHRQAITSDLLRVKASYFWHRLPQYSGRREPNWSNGWLAGFKGRKGLKDRRRHGEAGSVDEAAVMADLAAIQV